MINIEIKLVCFENSLIQSNFAEFLLVNQKRVDQSKINISRVVIIFTRLLDSLVSRRDQKLKICWDARNSVLSNWPLVNVYHIWQIPIWRVEYHHFESKQDPFRFQHWNHMDCHCHYKSLYMYHFNICTFCSTKFGFLVIIYCCHETFFGRYISWAQFCWQYLFISEEFLYMLKKFIVIIILSKHIQHVNVLTTCLLTTHQIIIREDIRCSL